MVHTKHLIAIFASLTLAMSAPPQNTRSIANLFSELSKPETTDRAAEQIVRVANSDSAAREYVARNLSGVIDNAATKAIWLNAIRLAGSLRIQQAIPSLVNALSRPLRPGELGGPLGTTFGAQMRLDHDPIGKSLSQIGDPSVPYLMEILRKGDFQMRSRAVLILINVNSPLSQTALRKALKNEGDSRLQNLIRKNLSAEQPA